MSSIFENTAYDGIADFYELWCLGDECYKPSLDFYTKYLAGMQSPMLEAGIGTGRIAGSLLHDNPEIMITGTDISNEMLKICAKKYKKFIDGKRLRLLRVDFCSEDFKFPEEFATIYMPFRTIGHLIDSRHIESFFRRVFSSLKRGGIFIFDHYVFCRQWAECHNRVSRTMYSNDEINISDFYIYDFEQHIMKCSVNVNDKTVQNFLFRWFDAEEFRILAENSGFIVRGVLGDFDGRRFSRDSDNQIWILEKPFT